MKRSDFFPVASSDHRHLELSPHRVRAYWTGEFREPKKGEWYLSGAIVEAYKAPNDLQSKYHIARLVQRS